MVWISRSVARLAPQHVVDEDRLVEVVVGETIGPRVQLCVRAAGFAGRADRAAPPDGRARGRSGSASARAAGDGGGAHLLAGEHSGACHRTVGPEAAGWTAAGSAVSSSSARWCGAQEAPVASSSTARASSFSAPNSSAKVGSTECGLAAQRAYCSPRNAAFAPLKAEARMSTPAIASSSSSVRARHRRTRRLTEPLGAGFGRFAVMSPDCYADMRLRRGFSSERGAGSSGGHGGYNAPCPLLFLTMIRSMGRM